MRTPAPMALAASAPWRNIRRLRIPLPATESSDPGAEIFALIWSLLRCAAAHRVNPQSREPVQPAMGISPGSGCPVTKEAEGNAEKAPRLEEAGQEGGRDRAARCYIGLSCFDLGKWTMQDLSRRKAIFGFAVLAAASALM